MDIVKKIKNYTYNQRHCLGQGSFGRVYEGRSDEGLKVAIKKVQQSMINKDLYLRTSLQTQINIMKKLNHPNIVKLYDVVTTSNSIYLIMEYCAGGDLKRYCRNRKLTEDEGTTIIKQICKGFQQIVQVGIIHRDLKPANILVHEGVFKICDFGFAKFFNDTSRMTRTCVGTPIYMSPQVLCQKHYTDKTDVWSLGILYYELLFGKLPYYGATQDALYKNIVRGPLTIPNCSNFTSSLLRGMLQVDENKRYSWNKMFEIFNFAPLQPPQISSQKQINVFHKPIELKKQGSNNNLPNQQFEPQILGNYREPYAKNNNNNYYGGYEIEQDLGNGKKPQRRAINPLAFQNPLPQPFQNIQNVQNMPMIQNVPNQTQNQPAFVVQQKKEQIQIIANPINTPPMTSPALKQKPSLNSNDNANQNPRFLYFVLIQLIVEPIKNSGSYPQLVSALYKRAIDSYTKIIQRQKDKLTLYGKVLISEFQQLKSIQSQIPNFVNDNMQMSAQAVLRQVNQSGGRLQTSSIIWVQKLLTKNYTYEK